MRVITYPNCISRLVPSGCTSALTTLLLLFLRKMIHVWIDIKVPRH